MDEVGSTSPSNESTWLELILSHAPAALALIDENGTIHSVSEQFARLASMPRADVIGASVDTFFSPVRDQASPLGASARTLLSDGVTTLSALVTLNRPFLGLSFDNSLPLRVRLDRVSASVGSPPPGWVALTVEPLDGHSPLRHSPLDPSLASLISGTVPLAAHQAVSSACAVPQQEALLGDHEGHTPKGEGRIRDEFATMVAHDLRAPIAGIRLAAEWLGRRKEGRNVPADDQRVLDMLRRSAHRIDKMIGDLLDVSRIDSGKLAILREPCDPECLLADVIERSRLLAPKHRIQCHVVGALPSIQADAVRIDQVITNLVSNATKYSPAGSTVTVRASAQPGELIVSVADDGCGIALSEQARIFDRFYRGAAASPALRADGLGVGLFVTKTIVDAHGGRLWFESTVGKGTTFYLALPIRHAPEPTCTEAVC